MLQLKRLKQGQVKDILIVRHGATKMNNQSDMSEDRIRGHKNVPLSEDGIAEAHQAAADLLTFHPELIVASDLSRAADTGRIIAQTCHCPITLTPLLRPWNLGDMQGQQTDKMLPLIARYVREAPQQSVPGGESFAQFCARAFRGLRYAIQLAGDRLLVIVTHHRDERLFFSWKAKGFPPDLLIDLETFLAKGEAPGAVLQLSIPLSALFGYHL